jgi:hypothetical protein
LESIQRKDFGTIDNETGINEIITQELFASFVTGKSPEEHGLKVKKFSSD